MFGLDGDDHAIFDATLQFLQDVKAPMAFMFILAPRVGLEIRRQLQAEGRILHDDWTRYTSYECVFTPKKMTIQELEKEFWKIQQRFYSLPSIFKRLLWPPHPYSLQSLLSNLAFWYGAKRHIHPLTYY